MYPKSSGKTIWSRIRATLRVTPGFPSSWPPPPRRSTARSSPTSAVRGGQGRSCGHLEKKSPLHFGGSGDRRRHAQALREVEAEPVEEGSLGGVRAHHAAQAQLAAVLGRQDDVCALNTPEFIEDRARTPAEARASLPLLERLPQHVGEETDEDVGLDAVGALVPHRTNCQLALLDAERRLDVRELDVGAPQVLGRPVRHIGAQHVAAFAPPRPVIPLGPRRPRQPHAGQDRRIRYEVDHVPARRSLLPLKEALDLPLEAAAIQRPPRLGDPAPQAGHAVLDASAEPLVHRPFFLAAFHGADQHEGLDPVRADALLGFNALAHCLPVARLRERAGPLAELALRRPHEIAPPRLAEPFEVVLARHAAIHDPGGDPGLDTADRRSRAAPVTRADPPAPTPDTTSRRCAARSTARTGGRAPAPPPSWPRGPSPVPRAAAAPPLHRAATRARASSRATHRRTSAHAPAESASAGPGWPRPRRPR